MGIVASNYVIENEIIDKYRKEEFDFESYVNERSLSHDYQKYHFEIPDFAFTAFVKCWCPMYNLLMILDTSKNRILREFENDQRWIEDSSMNPSIRFFYSKDVKLIWNELKNISIGDIENSIDNPDLVKEISSIQGYWNERIEYKESIVMEFFELYKAFFQANLKNKGIIITYG